MEILKESKIRNKIRDQLSILIEQANRLTEKEDTPDTDFDPGDLSGVPAFIKKLLDPDRSPQSFAKLDQELDEKGSVDQQAWALLGFALTYTENSVDDAVTLLLKAKSFSPKIKKILDNAKKKASS